MSTKRRSAAVLASNGPAVSDSEREFAFSDLDFRSLAQLAYEHAGIVLSDAKKNLVYGRLSRRLRTLQIATFREYREYLASEPGELQSFINSLSTNLTKFFRESHHFADLRSHVAAPFSHSAHKAGSHRLRLWSAGCSTGEEPYSIAVVLKRDIPDIERRDVRILATDIDTEVLTRAARGVYSEEAIDEVPAPYRKYFQPNTEGEKAGQVFVDPAVQKLISFRQLNLLGPWPFKGLFDVIFCRNVMIYFDGPTKAKLVERFTQQIKPGGTLYIGHSESIHGGHPGLELVGRTIYRRV
jgi:chemotaxis protein methyltransferase CheR